jgi:hypothetical protein
MFPEGTHPVAASNRRILLIRREKHNECPCQQGVSFRLPRLSSPLKMIETIASSQGEF